MQRHDVGEHARWLHDLRNAVNTVLVTTHASRRLLENGEVDAAIAFLADVQPACARCKVLLDQPPP